MKSLQLSWNRQQFEEHTNGSDSDSDEDKDAHDTKYPEFDEDYQQPSYLSAICADMCSEEEEDEAPNRTRSKRKSFPKQTKSVKQQIESITAPQDLESNPSRYRQCRSHENTH